MRYRAFALMWAVLLGGVLLVMGVSAQSGSQGTAMRIEDLGLPEGASDAIPVDINDDGLVVVIGITEQGAAVYLYESGAFRQIGGDAAAGSVHASAINGDGIVSGWIEGGDGATRALMVGEDNLAEMPGDALSSRA